MVLAVLQYHWTGQVSQAERERMQASLATATNQFRQEFNAELQQLGLLYQPDMAVLATKDWQSYAVNCAALLEGADRRLVTGLYLWLADSTGSPQLLRLNRSKQAFETTPWPPELESVRDRYQRTFSNPGRAPARGPPVFLDPDSPDSAAASPSFPDPLASPGAPMVNEPFIGYLMMELSLDTMQRELLPELG